MENSDKVSSTEFEKFLEKYEVNRVRDSIRERILTIIVASLGLVAALAWDEALKHLFEILFGQIGTFTAQLIYAVVITAVAAAVSVYLGRIYTKRQEKKD